MISESLGEQLLKDVVGSGLCNGNSASLWWTSKEKLEDRGWLPVGRSARADP